MRCGAARSSAARTATSIPSRRGSASGAASAPGSAARASASRYHRSGVATSPPTRRSRSAATSDGSAPLDASASLRRSRSASGIGRPIDGARQSRRGAVNAPTSGGPSAPHAFIFRPSPTTTAARTWQSIPALLRG